MRPKILTAKNMLELKGWGEWGKGRGRTGEKQSAHQNKVILWSEIALFTENPVPVGTLALGNWTLNLLHLAVVFLTLFKG